MSSTKYKAIKNDLFIDNLGILTNSGFWESTRQFASHSNTGTFTNKGILEDQFDSFGGLGTFPEENELVNNGIIIQPITIEDDQITIAAPFTIGTNLTGNYEFGGDFGEELFNANNQSIGEFDIFDQIILEVKAVSRFNDAFIAQCINYLKVSQNRLSLLVNFGTERLEYKRIVF